MVGTAPGMGEPEGGEEFPHVNVVCRGAPEPLLNWKVTLEPGCWGVLRVGVI